MHDHPDLDAHDYDRDQDHLPDGEPEFDDTELPPMAGLAALNRIRRLVHAQARNIAWARAHADDIYDTDAITNSTGIDDGDDVDGSVEVDRGWEPTLHTSTAPPVVHDNRSNRDPRHGKRKSAGSFESGDGLWWSLLPGDGLGLTGPGAAGAARAYLLAAINDDPATFTDDACSVLLTTDVLDDLLGAQHHTGDPLAAYAALPPHVQVVSDIAQALEHLDHEILPRNRTLDAYDTAATSPATTDPVPGIPVHQHGAATGSSSSVPPMLVMLLPPVPDADHSAVAARLLSSLRLGAALNIRGIVLGAWPQGHELTVSESGWTPQGYLQVSDLAVVHAALGPTLDHPAGTRGAPSPSSALEPPEHAPVPTTTPTPGERTDHRSLPAQPGTTEQLRTSPEPVDPVAGGEEMGSGSTGPERGSPSRGGLPRPATSPPIPHPSEAPRVKTPSLSVSGPPTFVRVQVRVLGEPLILDRAGAPVPGLRSGATQLLVILATHRDGHPLMDIMEKIWPDATTRRAADRLSTEAANLRRTVRRALGRTEDRDPNTNAIINKGSFYVANPDLLDIDLWRLNDALTAARATNNPDERARHLHEAVAAHAGPLADRRDYPWADVHRHQIHRDGIRARLHLAALHTATGNVLAAVEVIGDAADLDPANEDLAHRAIHACTAADNAEGARARMRTLRAALAEIGEEPKAETVALTATIPPTRSRDH